MAWWIFQNLVVTTVLATAVLLICRFTRIGPVGRHALWVLVLVKFITPPLVTWPWAAPDPLRLAAESAVGSVGPVAVVAPVDVAALADVTEPLPTEPTVPADPAPAMPAGPVLLGIWILGSVIVLAVEALRLRRLSRRLRHAEPADRAIANRVTELSWQLGLNAVPVVAVKGISSPVIWCFGRPRLIWPAELPADSTDACIDGLLVHELAHVKRRDHVVGWIELAAGIVWWWNPLFWFVRAAVREQAELACDAWVISALPNGRRAYAESLLALSSSAIERPEPRMPGAVIGVRASSRRVLERRLVMIMKGRAPLRLPWAGLLTLALMAAATLPAWATGQQAPPPPPPPPVPVVQTAPPPPPAPVAVPAQSSQPRRAVPARPAPARRVRPDEPPTPPAPQAPRTAVPVRPSEIPAAPVTPAPTLAPSRRVAPQVAVPVTPAPTMAPTPREVRPEMMVPARRGPTPIEQTTPRTPPPPATPLPQRDVRVMAPKAGELPPVKLSRAAPAASLPADGQQLLQGFNAERDAIQADANRKVAARHDELIKQLEALQDKYSKAGKLDEALAIRDYLRAITGRR